ncbi:MAG: putative polymerase subfamily sigma factor, partial [Ilumatobacteraceae bacterium]|nr:putative polymerase subfamily sigma factor [Ilumatobacteraceae bacterium]
MAPEDCGANAMTRAEVGRLFDAHADAIFRYAARRVGADDAADVVSEAFVIALDRFAAYSLERGGARGWLFGIANNVLRHHWRSEQRCLAALARHHAVAVPGPDPLLDVDGRLDAEVEVERLLRQVADLPADDRDLLTMYAWEHLPYADIAAAMSIPVGTERSRLHRLRR